jgi:hypothetical protein
MYDDEGTMYTKFYKIIIILLNLLLFNRFSTTK